MGDMDDNFIYFLVAGLVIIAVLLVVFNAGIGGNDNAYKNVTFREPVSIKNVSGSFFVGITEKDAFQTYAFSIDSSNKRNDVGKDLGTFRVFNGLLFGEQKIKYNVASTGIDSIKINFEVLGGNDYGLLIIKANGAEIYHAKTAPGIYQIYVPATLLRSNTLIEMETTSSQWKIWAPSVYDINMQLEANGFTENSNEYKFIILDGFNSLENGRLNLAFDEAIGSADIYVNNNKVYSGPLRDVQTFAIDSSVMNIGENTISFVPQEDSEFIGRANLVVFFKVAEESVMRIPLNFTITDVEKLPGKIDFDIVDLQRTGAVSVKLYRGNELLFSDFAKAEEAHYSFDLTNAKTGPSILFIEAMDNAAFLVKNLDIRV